MTRLRACPKSAKATSCESSSLAYFPGKALKPSIAEARASTCRASAYARWGKLRSTLPIAKTPAPIKPLRGVRVLSLALNIPGPAALMRLRTLGATCSKLEPPTGDPMGLYNRATYALLQQGVKVFSADLRAEPGQKALHKALARTDVLLTSFRPSALNKLGLDWNSLHKSYPQLSQVAIVGSHGARAEEPGHDLTYMAEHGLVPGLDMPPTLFADMGGSLMAAEGVLAAVLEQRRIGKGVQVEVALSAAAAYLGLPHSWGLTTAGASLAGAHAGYRVYPCKDGRVAVAALEPHFALALCKAAGIAVVDRSTMMMPQTHSAVAAFLLSQSCQALDALGRSDDIPFFTMPA